MLRLRVTCCCLVSVLSLPAAPKFVYYSMLVCNVSDSLLPL